MTAPITEVQVLAARARWRADLLELSAVDHERIVGDDGGPTAQSLLDAATSKRAEATIHMDLAEAMERHSVAKVERDADPKDADAQARYVAARDALVDLRTYWRSINEYLGLYRPVMTVDDFPEPTDDEVLATHGGEN